MLLCVSSQVGLSSFALIFMQIRSAQHDSPHLKTPKKPFKLTTDNCTQGELQPLQELPLITVFCCFFFQNQIWLNCGSRRAPVSHPLVHSTNIPSHIIDFIINSNSLFSLVIQYLLNHPETDVKGHLLCIFGSLWLWKKWQYLLYPLNKRMALFTCKYRYFESSRVCRRCTSANAVASWLSWTIILVTIWQKMPKRTSKAQQLIHNISYF